MKRFFPNKMCSFGMTSHYGKLVCRAVAFRLFNGTIQLLALPVSVCNGYAHCGCKSSSSFITERCWCLCICLSRALLLHDGHNEVILGHEVVLGDESCESPAQIRFILEQSFKTVCILQIQKPFLN